MGRAKISLELMKNERARHATFHKRKNGLKKNAHELSTLCGIKVCMIIYGLEQDDQQDEPEIWPTDPLEIQDLINKYKDQSIPDRVKRTNGLLDYFEDRKKNAENMFDKLRMKNNAAKYSMWDNQYDTLSEEQLRRFGSFLKSKIEAVKTMFESVKGNQNHYYSMPSLFRRSSVEFEAIRPSNISPVHPISAFDQTLHGFPLDANLMANPMMIMLMKNNTCSQPCGAAGSNVLYAPVPGLAYYDPMSGMLKSMMVNEATPLMCYYGPTMEQMPQYMRYPIRRGASSQMHASQMGG